MTQPSKKSGAVEIASAWCVAALSIVLTACGGGGGSGAPPVPRALATTVSGPGSVALTSSANAVAPTSDVSVTIANAPATVFLNASLFTSNGIQSIENVTSTATSGNFRILLKPPNMLAPAVYSDTVTVRLCGDLACAQILATTSIPVSFTVTAPVGATAPSVTVLPPVVRVFDRLGVMPDESQARALLANAFTFANFAVPPVVRVEQIDAGTEATADYRSTDATHGGVMWTFRAPSLLASGEYVRSYDFRICLDANCVNEVPGGPYRFTARYTVAMAGTMEYSGGMTVSALPLQVVKLAASPNNSYMFAVVSGPDSLYAINTGVTSAFPLALPSGLRATDVSLSQGGVNFIVATDQPVVYLRSADPPFNGGGNELAMPGIVTSLAGVPCGSGSVCFAASGAGFFNIYNASTPRPNSVALPPGDSLTGLRWSGRSRLYANYHTTTPTRMCEYALDLDGVSGGNCGPASTASASVVGDLLYERGPGDFRNAADWSLAGRIESPPPFPPTRVIGAVTSAGPGWDNKVFAYVSYGTAGCLIETYDSTTHALVDRMRLPTINPVENDGSCRYNPDTLARFGTQGLAIATERVNDSVPAYLLVFQGGFINPLFTPFPPVPVGVPVIAGFQTTQ